MRYRTTIEIVSEAKDKLEAAEVAGEYLSGNVMSGIKMKCATKPAINKARNIVGVLAISFIFIVTAVCVAYVKPAQVLPHAISVNDAIQPPLKTSDTNKKSADFKKDWQDKQNKAAMNFIKR